MSAAPVSVLVLAPQKAFAITCGSGTDIGGGQCRVFLVSGTSWPVPDDWSSDNTIEVIGAGAGGSVAGSTPGTGGGGGAYSSITELSLTPAASVTYQISDSGAPDTAGTDTFFNRHTGVATTCSVGEMSVCAKGGVDGTASLGGPGGAEGSGIGTVVNSGGTGGHDGADVGGGGGGGAAGPSADGAVGGAGDTTNSECAAGGGGGANGGTAGSDGQANGDGGDGGDGPNASGGGIGDAGDGNVGTDGGGGAGGASDTSADCNGAGNAFSGGNGGNGTEWSTHGAGGGGGGGGGDDADNGGNGGNGGAYGGGGGGAGANFFGGGTDGTAGTGGEGLIVITYTPAAGRITLIKPPNNLGLVGYWSFNEGTGTIATDFSGNGNAGRLTNNTGTNPAWVNGKRGKALSFFDRSYVDVGNTSAYNFTTGSFSVAFWIKSSSLGDGDSLIVRSTDPDGWHIDTSNAIDLATCQSGPTCQHTVGVTRLDNGKWHHAVITRSGSVAKIYIDGAEDSYTAQGTHINPVTSTANLHFGTDSQAVNAPTMMMDEVRIYNRALSATEVAKLAKAGAVKINASSVDLQRGSTLANGLVGHWTFDGADVTTTVTDRSGQNNHGGFIGGATSSAKIIGKLGQALQFDGSNDRVATSDLNNLTDNASQLSIALWMKAANVSNVYSAVSKWGGDGWSFSAQDNALDFGRANGNHGETSGGTHAAGVWEHWVAVFDETQAADADCLKIYKNGVSQALSFLGTLCSPTGSNSNVVTLGADTGGGAEFPGLLDDVRIYNRALSAAEVKQLYNLGTVIIRQ